MISFENVAKVYDAKSRPALDSVTLDVARGEFVFLVGASGSGKSTLLQLVLREQRPTKGKVLVAGKDIAKLPSWKVPHLRRQMGAVFQDFRLLPNKTVFENVAFALQVIGKSRSHINTTVPEVLEMVGLSDKHKRLPHELSGGEQQRVAIARAIANRPVLLLADEPTGNLDPTTSLGIMRVLDRIQRGGTTVVMATHDDVFVNAMRKRVIELSEGRVVRDEDFGEYTTTHIPVIHLTPPEEQIVEEIAEEEALVDAELEAAGGAPHTTQQDGWVPKAPAGADDQPDDHPAPAEAATPAVQPEPEPQTETAAQQEPEPVDPEQALTEPETAPQTEPETAPEAAVEGTRPAVAQVPTQSRQQNESLAGLAALAAEQAQQDEAAEQHEPRQSDATNLAKHLADRLRRSEDQPAAEADTTDVADPEPEPAPAPPAQRSRGRHASAAAATQPEPTPAAEPEEAEEPEVVAERVRSRRAERANRAQRSGLFRRR